MPKVRSLSEFNRNQSAFIDELAESKKPLYLTRNGRDSIVVMDSEAFDELISFRNERRAREMRIYDGLMRGYEDYLAGRVVPADEAEQQIRAAKGWL